MFVLPFLALALALVVAPAAAQDYSAAHNVTPITGTWTTLSHAVITGTFANPANLTFNYPDNTGVGYAFSDDGFYEVARYRFNGNGSNPACITGVMNWHHGKYSLLANGSIVLNPFGDGYQQIQDPCAAESNFIENYNVTELISQWNLIDDPNDGLKLFLFGADGTPVAPLYQVYSTANMLPTEALRNVTPSVDAVSLVALNSGARSWSPASAVSAVVGAFALGLASLIL
ncbi:chaperone for protein-folding within the ER, fungal-domain-containing protein [Lenzites betulinus]|nr:chaperone for protein-folding within the ER, fungal-domain-containing protein [Lenzites betulinus]